MLGKNIEDRESGDLNTFLGKGSVVEGSIKVQGTLRVDGRVKGQVSATDSLVIGKEGEIEGEVRVKNAIVGGRDKGKSSPAAVVLEAKSTFYGELKTSKLVIDEGAIFEGMCSMTDDGKILALPEGGAPGVKSDRILRPEVQVNR
jgi:cytoskeletal protein CcmA (bactofilin family)